MGTSPITFSFEAIGTRWTIDVDQDITDEDFAELQAVVRLRIDDFDKTYSRFRDDSLVTQIAKKAGTYEFPDDAERLFDFYQKLYEVSSGDVTPLIGNLISDAGYDATYSLKPQKLLRPAPGWESVMSYAHPQLKTKTPVLLDFGAAGKGYIVDIIGDLMIERGIDSFCIDAGGDILRKNTRNETIRIGLEHPSNPQQAIGVIQLGEGSICGSGTNRRKWGNLHHIIDPHTTEPVEGIIATWAVADNSLIADGMATALFFTNPLTLRAVWQFEYCLVRSDYSMEKSSKLNAEIFIRET